MKQITPAVITAIRRNLVEFGYQVDDATVKAEVDKVVAGEKPTVIGMFAGTMLREGGYLPEEAN